MLNSLGSPASRRVYEYAIDQFIAWYCSEPRLAFNRIVVVRYRMHLESRGLAANTINQQLAAVRRLAHEAADAGLLSPELAAGISRVKGVKQLGFRAGNWLSTEQSSEVLTHACGSTMRAKRDYAMLAMLLGCGFRRSELVGLEVDEIQMRQGHWAVVDLIGKGGHIRTVPIPAWVKTALDQWILAARVTEGRIFRSVARTGKVWGTGISQNVVWYVVRSCCGRAGLEHIAPHDLRRTCAKLCHDSGGALEQIQFLLGHASVQTTERYLGCKQNLGHPVNDLFNLKTDRKPPENDVDSVTVQASASVETRTPQGIECRHGGSEHDQPVSEPRPLPLPERTDLVVDNQKKADKEKLIDHRRQEGFVSKYANNVHLEMSTWDLKMTFGELDQSLGPHVVMQHTAMTMSWTYVKLLAYLLQINVMSYEANNGRIIIPQGLIIPIPEEKPSDIHVTDEDFAAAVPFMRTLSPRIQKRHHTTIVKARKNHESR